MRQGTGERWYRGSDRILGGVCSGLAAGLRIDPLWVRITFVLLALVQGMGILIYVVLWFVIPESAGVQPIGRSRFDSMMADVRRAWDTLQGRLGGTITAPARPTWRNPSVALGLVLVVVGVLFLAENLGFVNWNVVWPVALIVIGLLLLARSGAKRS